MSSGATIVKRLRFRSPVSGGTRQINIAYLWPGPKEVLPLHVYAYQDELTQEVVEQLNSQMEEVATSLGKDWVAVDHLTPFDERGFDFEEICRKVKAGADPFWVTGFDPLEDRL